MANLTLAIDDDLLRAARSYAQAHDTTVNALVRKLLEQAVRPPPSRLAERLRELSKLAKPEPGWRFSREETYAERMDELERRRNRRVADNDGNDAG